MCGSKSAIFIYLFIYFIIITIIYFLQLFIAFNSVYYFISILYI